MFECLYGFVFCVHDGYVLADREYFRFPPFVSNSVRKAHVVLYFLIFLLSVTAPHNEAENLELETVAEISSSTTCFPRRHQFYAAITVRTRRPIGISGHILGVETELDDPPCSDERICVCGHWWE